MKIHNISVANLRGTFYKGGVFYDLYATLTIATNKATVSATRVYAAGDGMDYGRSAELAPAVTAIYGI